MADRLAVARMAHKQAMAALKEVGLRLEYDGTGAVAAEADAEATEAEPNSEPPTMDDGAEDAPMDADGVAGATQAAPGDFETEDAIDEEPRETENDGDRIVGMDVLYASVPASEGTMDETIEHASSLTSLYTLSSSAIAGSSSLASVSGLSFV